MPVRFLRQQMSVMLAAFLLLISAVHASDESPMHPLVGQIRDSAQKNFIDRAQLAQRLAGVDILLLGERHDNPEHHRHQVWFLQQLARVHDRVSVAFEMIDQQQGKLLRQQEFDSADELIDLLDQYPNGWEYSTYYRELFATTIDNGFTIQAANMNRRHLREILRNDKPVDPAYRHRLAHAPWSNAQQASLTREIKESHCNMLDKNMIGMMVRAQRLRDALMAETITESEQPVKVLIAGNGHVRKDRGVPVYLDQDAEILSVGFIEVDPRRLNVEDYALPFDIAWFTSPVEREDPCESFRRQMQRPSSADK